MMVMLGVGRLGVYAVLLLVLITYKIQLSFYTSFFILENDKKKILSRGHRKKKWTMDKVKLNIHQN